MKTKKLQIVDDNVSEFMDGKLSLQPEKNTNKMILFDTSRVGEETKMDKTIENLPSTNNEFYIIHELGTN